MRSGLLPAIPFHQKADGMRPTLGSLLMEDGYRLNHPMQAVRCQFGVPSREAPDALSQASGKNASSAPDGACGRFGGAGSVAGVFAIWDRNK